MRITTMVVSALMALALGAACVGLPEADAARYNAEVRRGCDQIRATRPQAECAPYRRETFDTAWLLIAAVLCVGAVVMGVQSRKG